MKEKAFGGENCLISRDIEYFDVEVPSTQDIPLHSNKKHFRSSTAITVQTHLLNTWMDCIQKGTPLPAVQIHHYLHETGDRNEDIATNGRCAEDTTLDSEHCVEDTTSEKDQGHSTCISMTMCEAEVFDCYHSTDTADDSTSTNAKRPILDSPPFRGALDQQSSSSSSTPARREISLNPTRLMGRSTGYTFLTKIGTTVSKLLGTENKSVLDLDKAKAALKQQPKSHYLKKRYLEMEGGTAVLKLYGDNNTEIMKREKEFASQHHRFPTKSDICKDSQISQIYKQKHIAKELLQSWNITIHI